MLEGIAIKNSNNTYILHSEAQTMYLALVLTSYSIKNISIGKETLVSPEYRNAGILTYVESFRAKTAIDTTAVMPFLNFPLSGTTVIPSNIIETTLTTTTDGVYYVTCKVLVQDTRNITRDPSIYLFINSATALDPLDDYGFKTIDADGHTTFDSSKRPLVVTDTVTLNPPTRVDAVNSYNSINLDPINTSSVTASVDPVNSIIYCPMQADGGEYRTYTITDKVKNCSEYIGKTPTGNEVGCYGDDYKIYAYAGFAYYKSVIALQATSLSVKYCPLKVLYKTSVSPTFTKLRKDSWFMAFLAYNVAFFSDPTGVILNGPKNFDLVMKSFFGDSSDPEFHIDVLGDTTRNADTSYIAIISDKNYYD